MQENVYERIHQVLTWKRVIAFNMVLFLVLVVPLSVKLAQKDTENRSSASEGSEIPSVTPPPSYPLENPQIERVSEFFGKKGDVVVVVGKNFGDYQWSSRLYVGNAEVQSEGIVRWSNNIIEAQIPGGAKTGKVWMIVNGRRTGWEGNFLLTDITQSAQLGIKEESATVATIWTNNAVGVTRGMVEFSYLSEPVIIGLLTKGNITAEVKSVDTLGKKIKIEFTLDSELSSNTINLLKIEHPEIGTFEILRAELYNARESLVSLYIDPLNIKIN